MTTLQQFHDKLKTEQHPAYAPFDYFPHADPAIITEQILDGCFGDKCRDAFIAAWQDYQDEQVATMFD